MTAPRLLLLDVETSPAIVYAWGLHDQNISVDQIIEPSRTICWGAKWLNHGSVMYADERKGARKMFLGIHALLSECDAVVSFNGDHFDLQKLDGEFVFHRIPPPPPITSIDLYKTVRALGYISGKLAFVAPYLKIGQKIKNEGFPLWRGCMNGDAECWKRMQTYNKGDVRLLQNFYLLLRPYIRNHPRLGAPKIGTPRFECRHCGECNGPRQSRGYRNTLVFRIQRIQCLKCGGWGDGQKERRYSS